MLNTNKQQRNLLRIIHIFTSVVLGIFIYSPWRQNQTFVIAMSFAIFPILAFTGLWMWQASRIKLWLKQVESSSSSKTVRN